MTKFKNIADRDQTVPGVGIVKAGEIVELPETFHNANFERVKKVFTAPSNKIIDNTPKTK